MLEEMMGWKRQRQIAIQYKKNFLTNFHLTPSENGLLWEVVAAFLCLEVLK